MAEKKNQQKTVTKKKTTSTTKKMTNTNTKKGTKAISKTSDSSKKSVKNSTSKTTVKKPQNQKKVVKVAPKKQKRSLEQTMTLDPIELELRLKEKSKAKAISKSRQANSKQQAITEKRKKKEATRVIPVEEILKAQEKAVKPIKETKIATPKSTKNNNAKLQKNVKSKQSIKNKSKKHNSLSLSAIPARMRKIFLSIFALCIIILIIEGIYFLVYRNNVLKNRVYYDSLNSLTLDGTDIVAVGSSNFKHSKYNDYTKGIEKAKIIKYNQNGELIFEKMFSDGVNSTFNSIIQVEDGYVIAGSYEKNEEQATEKLRDALIVKYDPDGNIIWKKTFSSLSNTEFYKVIAVEDGYVVVGQSLYAPMEMGNSTEGGGVIIKYNFDGDIVWKNFHGGTKSARFNDLIEVEGNLYVVGRDGTDFGNLVKFSKDGQYDWHKNYRYTDTLGLSGITYSNGNFYVVGTKKVFDHEVDDDSKRDTSNTDAILIQYNLNGDIQFEKTFGGSNLERYNSIMCYHDHLFAIGSSNSTDSGLKIFTDGIATTGILVKYDLNGNIERKNVFGGSKQDNLTAIVTDNSNLYITAYTNSKDGNIITSLDNGKDYFGRLIKVDYRLRVLFLK